MPQRSAKSRSNRGYLNDKNRYTTSEYSDEYYDEYDDEYYDNSEETGYYDEEYDSEYYDDSNEPEYYDEYGDPNESEYYDDEYYNDEYDSGEYDSPEDSEYYDEEYDKSDYDSATYSEIEVEEDDEEYAIGKNPDKYLNDVHPLGEADDAYYEEDYQGSSSGDGYQSSYYDDYDDNYNDEYQDDYYDNSSSSKIKTWFKSRTLTDYMLMGGGLVAVILFVIIGFTFFSSEMSGNKLSARFADVGAEVKDIGIIGYDGIMAAADAKAAKAQADAALEEALLEEELQEGENSENATVVEQNKTVVIMTLTSIQRDLKIKFVNNDTKKLVTGVPFEISIVDPSGKTISKTNTDLDGVIYMKNITPGRYQVALVGADEGYLFSKDAIGINVRDTIEYKKVDVAAEIKSENEIDVAKEDTAKNDTEVESTLTDTVEWVESTKTLISDSGKEEVTYEAVSNDVIADPGKSANLNMDLLGRKYEPDDGGEETTTSEPEPTPEEKPAEEPSASPTEEPTPIESPTPEQEPSATQEPTPTATSEPTPIESPTESATPSVSPSVSPSPSASVSPSASPSASPTAEEKARKDTTSTLKTLDGEILFVKDGDTYREAKFADYYTFKTFYRKKINKDAGNYKYTGWQNIDGYTYFFNKDGNFVTGEQIIQGAKYVFESDGRLNAGSGVVGIDVSKFNGKINWTEVKNSGISFVIIRCGFRGSSVGALVEDVNFKANIKGATDAGLKVGVYFFTQAIDEVEAVEEASMVLSLIRGYNISYPIFLDVESSGGRGDKIDAATRTKVCQAFCKTINNSGYKAGVYANKTWFNSLINTPDIAGNKIWLAQYAASPSYSRTRYDLWQYTSKGKVNGISGNVDMNISYLGY